MQTEKEIIEALEAKVEEYEKILEETLSDSAKSFAKITAGPFEDKDGKIYYRATKGSDAIMVFISPNPLIGSEEFEKELKADTEVIIVGQTIAAVVPEELKPIVEVPEFKLITWDEIGGMSSQIDQIKEAVELPMKNAKMAEELGVELVNGIILYGPPGCGKTLIAKAIASTVLGKTTVDPRAFTYVKGAELLSKYVGQTEQDIKNIFDQARAYEKATGEKAVLFIDEAEALLPRRGSRKSSDVETTIVPTFLSEMSGFEGYNPIVILATNLKDNIDEAILREGRIDIKIKINRPTQTDALEIFEIHLKKLKTHNPVPDLAKFATEALFKCPAVIKNISGAMIEKISKDAVRKTMVRMTKEPKTKEKGITYTDIVEAITSINNSYVTKA